MYINYVSLRRIDVKDQFRVWICLILPLIDSVIAEPSLVATIKSYFSKSTGRNEADVLADKVIYPNNLWGKPGKRQHDTHFSGATKEFSLMF